MNPTKEEKMELVQLLRRLGLLPVRSGEVCISISPQGTAGNIKIINNTG